MTGKPRTNASGKTLLKYFMQKCEEAGSSYFPLVPWDERNLNEQKEYYSVEIIVKAMDYYFLTTSGGWKVADFLRGLPDLCERMQTDEISRQNYAKLMKETRDRMKEAGLDI